MATPLALHPGSRPGELRDRGPTPQSGADRPRRKVTLVCPQWPDRGLNSVSFFGLPPQGLTQIAALTPPDWDVEIVDENIRAIDYDSPTDLVGLTGMTCLAPRAYQIAERFRARGVPTIMGGIHASALPEEAGRYVDSVVVGEGDEIWPTVLDDARHGTLRPRYLATAPSHLDFDLRRPVQRTYSVPFSRYFPFSIRFAYLQTSRGCPVNCQFCSVTTFNGKAVRTVSIPYLVRQIQAEAANGAEYFVFVDDNIVVNKRWARDLFRALVPLKIRWMSQTDVRIADDDILPLAVESGMVGVFLGLESISAPTLKDGVAAAKKSWRPRYEQAIRRLRENGIIIEGSFIFGFDADDRQVVRDTLDWAIAQKIDVAQLSILTPLPGTRLYDQMKSAGRLVSSDWADYNVFNCVFAPNNWTRQELEEELRQAYRRFYSFANIARRLNRKAPRQMTASVLTNIGFRRFRQ